MAIYLQPYPTMTDLRNQDMSLGTLRGPSMVGLAGLGSLFDPVLDKARAMGIPLPKIPDNATAAEQQVFLTLVSLAITEANLRQTHANLTPLLLKKMPVPCKVLLDYNKSVDDFRDLAAEVISKFILAGLATSATQFPKLPPRIEIDQRCVADPAALLSGGLGIVAVDDIILASALLIAAIGISGSLLLLAANWPDIQRSRSQARVAESVSSVGLSQSEVLKLATEKCKDDKACVAKVAAVLPTNTEALIKLANSLRVPEESSRGLFFWLGVVGVVGLAGAGIYHYRTQGKR